MILGNKKSVVGKAAMRRRARKARLAMSEAGIKADHGNPYWAKNWGCECLTCRGAVRKLNHEQYIARKAQATN